MPDKEQFSQTLLEWFDRSGRHDLPWQQDKTPYRVWVSEIMLQQTQVQTVIPYYERFMKAFPSVEALAQATQEDVLSHWSGLGYYARGRNLLKTAKIVVEDLQGEFPQDLEGVMALPGIGRSTAGAILSIACQQRHPILDGNVKRVLCRYDAVESWSGEKNTEITLWQRADELTPEHRFGDYTQAIMDLGATLCTRSKPKCELCPVQKNCQAWLLDRVSDFPYAKPKKEKPVRETAMMIFLNEDRQVFLQQRPQKGIWGGLWSLPEMIPGELEDLIKSKVESRCDKEFNLIKWPLFKHTFTHYHLMIHPFFLDEILSVQMEGKWFTVSEALTKGLPAPIRKLIKQLESSND
ncbi:A/G-specific adenine glycosylase [Hydrogenovibrio sp. 3SP14C1]|uniref:A/G-specific adenine glycosylase n=1 Tax=Hydrogenovibrio sp. 3SP14C1 TaxID=3038774 RepID=UPI002415EA3B|nr:A/G-specific adenine glycosylase [Hydrogenovibrio sp. 3SP14C1]MDG4813577.1 A/G-specific adenine glycosylase [Hydrogenovibrio sp. 3SP14C1]